MDVRYLLLLVYLCILFFPSRGLVLQKDTNGSSVHARWPLSLGNRQVLAIKAQDDKEEHMNKLDTTSTNLEKGSSADTGRKNSTDSKTKSGKNETDLISAPPRPPTKPEDAQPTLGKDTEVNNASSNVETAPPNETLTAPAILCGGNYCEDPKKLVSACLQMIPRDAHKLSLLITTEGELEVIEVVAPEYLAANRLNVSVSKGKNETIQFMMDSKLVCVKNKTITVITSHGNCSIEAPLDYLCSSAPEPLGKDTEVNNGFPYINSAVVVLVLVVALLGTWLCYKCCRKKRGGDVKYQQLEMIVPGQSTPKERDEQSTGAWDEVWDDDWEDAEAAKSSSRLSQTLSSRGLGARRGNKDGWDNSWDD